MVSTSVSTSVMVNTSVSTSGMVSTSVSTIVMVSTSVSTSGMVCTSVNTGVMVSTSVSTSVMVSTSFSTSGMVSTNVKTGVTVCTSVNTSASRQYVRCGTSDTGSQARLNSQSEIYANTDRDIHSYGYRHDSEESNLNISGSVTCVYFDYSCVSHSISLSLYKYTSNLLENSIERHCIDFCCSYKQIYVQSAHFGFCMRMDFMMQSPYSMRVTLYVAVFKKRFLPSEI